MIVNEVKPIGVGFACYNSATKDVSPIPNPGISATQRFGYAVAGEGTIRYTDIGVDVPFVENSLYDLRGYTASRKSDIFIDSDVAMCIVFFVNDPLQELDAVLLTAGSYNLTKTVDEEVVFVVKGTAFADSVSIPAKKFAHLPDGRAVQLVVPEGAVAIHFKKPALVS